MGITDNYERTKINRTGIECFLTSITKGIFLLFNSIGYFSVCYRFFLITICQKNYARKNSALRIVNQICASYADSDKVKYFFVFNYINTSKGSSGAKTVLKTKCLTPRFDEFLFCVRKIRKSFENSRLLQNHQTDKIKIISYDAYKQSKRLHPEIKLCCKHF